MQTLNLFIGYDPAETVAYHVLAHSIIRRATVPVTITPLARKQLERIYTRPRSDKEATDFSISRFLVPALCNYQGFAVFMDCDMLCRVDIGELWLHILSQFGTEGALRDDAKAVLVCQHDYTPSTSVKFLNQPQSAYPRKNWSSVMIFNNARCRALTPEYVNSATGLDLHRFNWLEDDRLIGSLPLAWNHLVGEYAPSETAKVLHFTLGGPWFDGTRACDHAEEWTAELESLMGNASAVPVPL